MNVASLLIGALLALSGTSAAFGAHPRPPLRDAAVQRLPDIDLTAPAPHAEPARGVLPSLLALQSWPGAVCLSGSLAYTPARSLPNASPITKNLLLSPALLNADRGLGAGVGAVTRF